MKNTLKFLLQSILGIKAYLFIFALFKIKTLKYDRKEKDFFKFLALLKRNPKGVVIDAGANIGIMTALLSRNLPDTKIYSFEPIPENYHALKRIYSYLNLSNVHLHNCALGQKEDTLEMVLPQTGKVKQPGLSHVIHKDITEFNEGNKYKVPVYRLDKMVNTNQPVTGIKIDVENFEYAVLKGAEKIIQKHHPIIYIELWDNQNRQNCFQWAKQMNYEIMVTEKDQLTPYSPGVHSQQNFFFVPEK